MSPSDNQIFSEPNRETGASAVSAAQPPSVTQQKSALASCLFPWSSALLAIVWAALFPSEAEELAPWFFFASLFLLGMPHGFIDAIILTTPRLSARVYGEGVFFKRLLSYIGIAAVYALIWWLSPAFAMASFLALTAWHWGSSELGNSRSADRVWYALSVSRGCIILASLFFFHQEQCVSATQPFGLSIPKLFAGWVLCCAVLLHCVTLLWLYRKNLALSIRPFSDLVLLMSLLSLTPAYLGVSVYYMCFHSFRYFTWFSGDNHSVFSESKKLFLYAHLISGSVIATFFIIFISLTTADIQALGRESIPYHLKALALLTLPHAFLATRLQLGISGWVSPTSILPNSPD